MQSRRAMMLMMPALMTAALLLGACGVPAAPRSAGADAVTPLSTTSSTSTSGTAPTPPTQPTADPSISSPNTDTSTEPTPSRQDAVTVGSAPDALLTFPAGVDPHQPADIDASTPIGAPHHCAGLDLGEGAGRYRGPSAEIVEPTTIEAIAVCIDGGSGVVTGDGTWSTRQTRDIPADRVAELASALAAPDVALPPNTACAAIAYLLPTLVVTLTDGTKRSLGYPSGGCYPLQRPVDLVYAVILDVPPTIERVERVLTETETVSGCTGSKAFGVSSDEIAPFPDLPAGNLTVCQYDENNVERPLQATGEASADVIAQLSSTLSNTPPEGCSPGAEQTEVPIFLQLLDPSTGDPVADIGLDRCHVVVDPGWRTVGWATEDTVTALTEHLTPAG